MSQIAVYRGLIWHHGILCRDGSVIHYTTSDSGGLILSGLSSTSMAGNSEASIQRTSFRFFKGNATEVYDVVYQRAENVFSPQEVERRARSRLGEKGYNLATNNCESFASWCVTGIDSSGQIVNAASCITGGLFAGGIFSGIGILTLLGVFYCFNRGNKLYSTIKFVKR